MGVRAIATAAATLLLTTGCAASAHNVPEHHPRPSTTTSTTTSSASTTPTHAQASHESRALANRFVQAVFAYDATKVSQLRFLQKAASLTTDAQHRRLRASERSRLNWPALRARRENVRVHVTGVTRVSQVKDVQLVVEFIRTTTTRFATIRTFDNLVLEVVETDCGLKVANAQGAGL